MLSSGKYTYYLQDPSTHIPARSPIHRSKSEPDNHVTLVFKGPKDNLAYCSAHLICEPDYKQWYRLEVFPPREDKKLSERLNSARPVGKYAICTCSPSSNALVFNADVLKAPHFLNPHRGGHRRYPLLSRRFVSDKCRSTPLWVCRGYREPRRVGTRVGGRLLLAWPAIGSTCTLCRLRIFWCYSRRAKRSLITPQIHSRSSRNPFINSSNSVKSLIDGIYTQINQEREGGRGKSASCL